MSDIQPPYHVSDFTKDQIDIVIDLINHDNAQYKAAFTSELLDFGLPVTNTNPETNRNTEIEVSAAEGSGYVGSVVVSYNRLNIQDFVDTMTEAGELRLPLGDGETFADFIPEINVALGINLTEEMYVDGQLGEWQGIPNETKTIQIPMHEDNLVYHGVLSVIIEAEDIPLEDVIVNRILMGLNLPEAPDFGPGQED